MSRPIIIPNTAPDTLGPYHIDYQIIGEGILKTVAALAMNHDGAIVGSAVSGSKSQAKSLLRRKLKKKGLL